MGGVQVAVERLPECSCARDECHTLGNDAQYRSHRGTGTEAVLAPPPGNSLADYRVSNPFWPGNLANPGCSTAPCCVQRVPPAAPLPAAFPPSSETRPPVYMPVHSHADVLRAVRSASSAHDFLGVAHTLSLTLKLPTANRAASPAKLAFLAFLGAFTAWPYFLFGGFLCAWWLAAERHLEFRKQRGTWFGLGLFAGLIGVLLHAYWQSGAQPAEFIELFTKRSSGGGIEASRS